MGKSVSDQGGVALIVRTENGNAAMIVDEVHGQNQVVVKKVEEYYHGNPMVSGAAVMGDGRVSLVIDTSSVRIEDLRKFK
jgi:two-component system chemotaxis sensor kinase CheA